MASTAPNGAPTGPKAGLIPPGPPPGGPPGPPMGFPPVQSGPSQSGPLRMQGYPGYVPPHQMPNFPPPLPAGWSEHTAPDGLMKYYYNSHTRESTYTRPTFSPFPAYPPPGGAATAAASVPAQPKEAKKKKEKPTAKVPIPGTTWTRVTTNAGNVFYFEKESKRSEWTVPEEIKEEVEKLEEEEHRLKAEEAAAKEAKEKEERLERLREQERVRLEVEEERKRKAEQAALRKRKAAEAEGDMGDGEDGVRKVVKTENGDGADGDGDEGEEGDGQYAPDEEGDEEWMKAVAAEFADLDQAQAEQEERDQEQTKRDEEEAAKKVFSMPDKVNVSLEEGRALFKALLMEKEISPFTPWEQSLPLFINDPRYVLLSSQKDRREVFEEYCRDVGRALRLKKGGPATIEKKVDPERDYKALLREDVTSTRTRWDDWRRKVRNDRRFLAYGRDNREREKLFKTHLRELGERKRADAQRAEEDFRELLKEVPDLSSSSIWADVKKGISKDARYDAVGSSSLREELFKSFVDKLASTSAKTETPEEAAERKLKERKAKQEASLRERQAQVRTEQEKVKEDVDKSRSGAGREEGERLFASLLVDQVRDPETSWNDAAQFLERDPRWNHPSLSMGNKRRIFENHLVLLWSKRSTDLWDMFAKHTKDLATPYDDVYPHIVEDPVVKRMGLEGDALEDRWKAWKRERESAARVEFDQLLAENSFVEFWGKMRKKVLDEKAQEIKEEDPEEGEGIGEGGSADLTGMAKQIDLNEIKSILRRDKRYRQFDHMPEIREQWLRDYLGGLEAASGSSTIHAIGGGR